MQVPSAGNNSYFQTKIYTKTSKNNGSENYNSSENLESVAIAQQEAYETDDTTPTGNEIKKVNTHLLQTLLAAWFQKKIEEAEINFQYKEGEITTSERDNLQNSLRQSSEVKSDTVGNNTEVIDLAKFIENVGITTLI